MSSPVVKRLISTEDYNKMAEIGMLKPDERVELINGEIYTMSPIGSRHAAVVDQMARLMNKVLSERTIIRIQNPVHINEWNEPEPDIAVLKFREDLYVHSHPVHADVQVIMEVSDSTYEFDRYVKLPVYAKSGIPSYWIVNLNDNCIEIYKRPEGDQFKVCDVYYPGGEVSILGEMISVSEVLILEE